MMGSHVLHIVISVLGGLLCFLPIMTHDVSYLGDTSYTQILADINNDGYAADIVAAVVLVLAAPLAINRFIDNCREIYMNTHGKDASNLLRSHFLNNVELYVVLAGSVLPPFVLFTTKSSKLSIADVAYVNACSRCSRFVLVPGMFLTSLSRHYPKSWRPLLTTLFILIHSTNSVCSTYQFNLISAGDPRQVPVEKFKQAATFISMAIFGIMCLLWLHDNVFAPLTRKWRIWRRSIDGPSENWSCFGWCGFYRRRSAISTNNTELGSTGDSAYDYDEMFDLLYLLLIVACAILLATTMYIAKLVIYYTPKTILVTDIPYAFIELALVVLKLQRTKSEVVAGLLKLLDAKRTHVRFISHELRTPLNTATLGLKLLDKRIREGARGGGGAVGVGAGAGSGEYDAEALLDLTTEVEFACATTVNILDDLLCYDKLESGILEVHKTEVPVIEFIVDSAKLFAAEARELDIELRCVFEHVERDWGMLSPDGEEMTAVRQLRPTDKIHVDKFKMNQVLRNLISNALKFSESGSTITISAMFVPARRRAADQASSAGSEPSNGQPANPFSFLLPILERFGWGQSPAPYETTNLVDLESGKDPNSDSNSMEGNLVVHIIDEGVGISYENQQRLFKEVVQFRPEILQAGGGSGFGLFICKGIVDRHRGKISVQSDGEGHGSTFTIQIPMRRDKKTKSKSTNVNGSVNGSVNGNLSGRSDADVIREVAYNASEDEDNHSTVSLVLMEPAAREKTPAQAQSQLKRGSGSGSYSYSRGSSDPVISCLETRIDDVIAEGENEDDDKSTGASLVASNPRNKHAEEAVSTDMKAYTEGASLRAKRKPTAEMVEDTATLEGARKHIRAKEDSSEPDPDPDAYDDNADHGDATVHTDEDTGRTDKRTRTGGIVVSPPRGLDAGTGAGSTETSRHRVLVVDDSMRSRKMLVALLTSEGFECDEAENGRQAVDMVKQTRTNTDIPSYDLIIMDFVMPQMDGLTATKKIRKLGYKGAIFGHTGKGMPSDVTHFMRCGADGVLVKPFALGEFHTEWSKFQSDKGGGGVPKAAREEDDLTPTGSGPSKEQYSVLVVDDSHQNRRFLSRLLASEGYICDEAIDGIDAVEKVRSSLADKKFAGYDIILMDFVMPKMDGPTATKEIRKLGWQGALLGLTGNGMQSDISRFLTEGADNVMVKPFDLHQFNKEVAVHRASGTFSMHASI